MMGCAVGIMRLEQLLLKLRVQDIIVLRYLMMFIILLGHVKNVNSFQKSEGRVPYL